MEDATLDTQKLPPVATASGEFSSAPAGGRRRACRPCALAKRSCVPANDDGSFPCARCVHFGIEHECVVAPAPAPRKPPTRPAGAVGEHGTSAGRSTASPRVKTFHGATDEARTSPHASLGRRSLDERDVMCPAPLRLAEDRVLKRSRQVGGLVADGSHASTPSEFDELAAGLEPRHSFVGISSESHAAAHISRKSAPAVMGLARPAAVHMPTIAAAAAATEPVRNSRSPAQATLEVMLYRALRRAHDAGQHIVYSLPVLPLAVPADELYARARPNGLVSLQQFAQPMAPMRLSAPGGPERERNLMSSALADAEWDTNVEATWMQVLSTASMPMFRIVYENPKEFDTSLRRTLQPSIQAGNRAWMHTLLLPKFIPDSYRPAAGEPLDTAVAAAALRIAAAMGVASPLGHFVSGQAAPELSTYNSLTDIELLALFDAGAIVHPQTRPRCHVAPAFSAAYYDAAAQALAERRQYFHVRTRVLRSRTFETSHAPLNGSPPEFTDLLEQFPHMRDLIVRHPLVPSLLQGLPTCSPWCVDLDEVANISYSPLGVVRSVTVLYGNVTAVLRPNLEPLSTSVARDVTAGTPAPRGGLTESMDALTLVRQYSEIISGAVSSPAGAAAAPGAAAFDAAQERLAATLAATGLEETHDTCELPKHACASSVSKSAVASPLVSFDTAGAFPLTARECPGVPPSAASPAMPPLSLPGSHIFPLSMAPPAYSLDLCPPTTLGALEFLGRRDRCDSLAAYAMDADGGATVRSTHALSGASDMLRDMLSGSPFSMLMDHDVSLDDF